MKTNPSLTRAALSLFNVFALLCGALLLPLPARGQTTGRTPSAAATPTPTPTPDDKGKPVVISFGQPSIWSLDQAHYLLSQLRERSLSLTAKELTDLDANETHGTRIDFMRQLFELVSEFKQPVPAPSPGASPAQTPTAFPSGTPERVASTDMLQGSLLSSILADADLRKRLFSDPKLNAITRLDNHIQLQYEIVARQLTLLRDEVRPGERLVFLELPQSIYTTDDKADDKLAQVWWEVEGYSEKNVRKKLEAAITLTSERINALMADAAVNKLWNEEKGIRGRIAEEERLRYRQEEVGEGAVLSAADRERLKALTDDPPDMSRHSCHSERLKESCRSNPGEPCRKFRDDCSKYRELSYWEQSREALEREAREEKDRDVRRAVESLVQRGPADFGDLTAKSGESQEAEEKYLQVGGATDAAARTAVRTIDIIPHQSSLNVNDVQETVKSSFIAASFSFLFGLGARTSFQRQRDQFEQFLHQELYASGFGKGESRFGWTFGPIPGTKRVAPGLRTTFAALVVPDKADSITLRARGCFFHREDNEPPDPFGQVPRRRWWNDNDRECGVTKQYRLRIPSGGGRENFWVSGIEYLPFKAAGQRMVALIKGQNFTTQVGVLVNGVPLRSVVELTRKLPASAARYDANANCPAICGEYEVIGQNDISIAFEMPDGFVGTPEITVVGAGRTVTLNHLPLLVRPYGEGTFPTLSGEDTPFMFGNGPPVRISEVKLFRDATSVAPNELILGVLRGRRRLNGRETIFVNGKPLAVAPTLADFIKGIGDAGFDSNQRLFRLRFKNPGDAKLDVMVVSGTTAETKTVVNPFEDTKRPAPLAVTGEEVLALDLAQGEMAVRLTGTGLAKATVQVVSGAAASEITSQSATELILRLAQPRVAVKIKITNPAGDDVTRAIIRRAPPRSVTERRDRTDEGNN